MAYTICHAAPESSVDDAIELLPWQLWNLAEWCLNESLRYRYELCSCYGNIYLTSLILEHGKQCLLCSASCSVIFQTKILSTETWDFLKQITVVKSFNSMFHVHVISLVRITLLKRLQWFQQEIYWRNKKIYLRNNFSLPVNYRWLTHVVGGQITKY